MRYENRYDAGRRLALSLSDYAGRPDVTVLALPRGGVPVGFEIARALRVPLDVFVVRKLGVPGQPEFAMGAIASGGALVLDQQTISDLRIPRDAVERVIAKERAELVRREELFRGSRPPVDVSGRTVILVDDGLATGSTVQAAIAALRKEGPASIIVAAPVGSREACSAIGAVTDGCLCAMIPDRFYAVGLWYEDFSETTDAEVRQLLTRAGELDGAVSLATSSEAE
ncbi:MAG TPA: phosphoribosyltransferase [Gemmatimonadaceae bacterium]|nr:phosphoribosyltransferase [Gemmatimonadaceae bacterium]